MPAAYLLPETELRESGSGPAFDLSSMGEETARESILITLGITHIVEQESLDLEIEGSPDGVAWNAKRLLAFPQKFYTGRYQILLDLASHPGVRYVRAKWKLNRWGRGDLNPRFGVFVGLETQSMPVAKVVGQA